MKDKASTIDEYLSRLEPDQRAALQAVRHAIRLAAPGAEECISYQMPAFRLKQKVLVAFGATKTHCALYPMSGTTVETLRDALESYDTSKGAIRFPPDHPLLPELVRTVVEMRVAENARSGGRDPAHD